MSDQSRIDFLVAQRIKASDAYYNGTPIMSDIAFDTFEAELRRLAPEHLCFSQYRAPVISIGTKHKHEVPMSSLNKANFLEEVKKWLEKCGVKTVFASEKADGSSISLYYRKGAFTRAATGGDGIEGVDVTRNVLLMQGLPKQLHGKHSNFSGHVRGEVVVTKEDFAKYFPDESDARSMANGVLQRVSDYESCKHLTLLCYQVQSDMGLLPSKKEEFDFLKANKFWVPNHWLHASLEDIEHVYKTYVAEGRARLNYVIDGLVLEVDSADVREALGESNSNPAGAIAFKFPRDAKETILRDVVRQVGKGGRVTAVAYFDPVVLCSTNVKQCTLHNESNIKRLAQLGAGRDHLAVGDTVLISKAGDVIPFFEALTKPSKGKLLEPPTQCPECSAPLIYNGEYLTCPNKTLCPAQTQGMIKRWLEKVGVLEWGDALIGALTECGMVGKPSDLYALTEPVLATTLVNGRLHGARAKSCIANLHAKKNLTLDIVVGSLGMPLWGQEMVKVLVQAGYETLDSMKNAKAEDLVKIKKVGPTKAEAFVSGLVEVLPEIEALLIAGISISAVKEGPMKGQTVCFTGHRNQALREAIVNAGGTYKDGYSKAVTYVVTKEPDSDSDKFRLAIKNGTKIIDIEEMWRMLK